MLCVCAYIHHVCNVVPMFYYDQYSATFVYVSAVQYEGVWRPFSASCARKVCKSTRIKTKF